MVKDRTIGKRRGGSQLRVGRSGQHGPIQIATAPDNFTLVKQAIRNLQHVVATYDGHLREMCPHALGTKGGKHHGLFFQFAGGTKSRSRRDVYLGRSSGGTGKGTWLCIPLDDLSIQALRPGPWHTGKLGEPQPFACLDSTEVEANLPRQEVRE